MIWLGTILNPNIGRHVGVTSVQNNLRQNRKEEIPMKKIVALCLALLMVLSFSGVAMAADHYQHSSLLGFLSEMFPFASLCPHNWIRSYVGSPYYATHNGQIHQHQKVMNRCTICGDYYYSEDCFGLAK